MGEGCGLRQPANQRSSGGRWGALFKDKDKDSLFKHAAEPVTINFNTDIRTMAKGDETGINPQVCWHCRWPTPDVANTIYLQDCQTILFFSNHDYAINFHG